MPRYFITLDSTEDQFILSSRTVTAESDIHAEELAWQLLRTHRLEHSAATRWNRFTIILVPPTGETCRIVAINGYGVAYPIYANLDAPAVRDGQA